MYKTAVVILNWNGRKHLEKYLPSVVAYSKNADVIIVDNNSTDDSISFLTSSYPSLRIIQTGKNLGYAGGYNKAMDEIDHQYAILLNSDVDITENWISAMEDCMQNDPTVAACQPLILQDLDHEYFEYAGAAGGFIDKYGYPFCRGRIFESMEKNTGQYTDADVFWAGGACIMVRTEMFKSIHGFETEFFAHMEEIDLCWRFLNQGYKIKCCSGSKVYHLGGGTLDKSNPKKTYLNFRNSLLMLARNHPKNGYLSAIFFRLFLDGIAGIKFLLSAQPGHVMAIIRSHFYFYFNYSRWTKERNSLPESFPPGVYLKSIVIEHFARSKKYFNELDGKFSG